MTNLKSVRYLGDQYDVLLVGYKPSVSSTGPNIRKCQVESGRRASLHARPVSAEPLQPVPM